MKKRTKTILGVTGCVILVGSLVAGVLIAFKLQDATQNITYTLDSDVVLKKINNDIEIVSDAPYKGVNIAHKVRTNGTFKVMAVTDLHLDHKQECCNYTYSMLARNIIKEEPDLVVLCGDNITSSFNEARTKQFGVLMESLGVYWSAILGNHEKNASNPYSIGRQEMIDIWGTKSKFPHCLIDPSIKKTSSGESVWGVGNQIINLINEKGVVQSIYFLDSGTEMTNDDMTKYSKEIQQFKDWGKAKQTETEFYDYIKDSQVTWYKDTFSEIKKQSPSTHSTIISHVPLKEQESGYLKLMNAWEDEKGMTHSERCPDAKIRVFTDYPQDKAKTINELFNEDEGYLKGERLRKREDCCTSPHDYAYADKETPIFKAMRDFGDNNVFLCGHDHQNNYVVKYGGVILGYVQPACYSSNNLYTKGMLGKDPKVEEAKYNNCDHLIQGYSILTYSQNENSTTKNVLTNYEAKENYYLYPDKNMRERVLDYIAKTRKTAYADNHKSYLDKEVVE